MTEVNLELQQQLARMGVEVWRLGVRLHAGRADRLQDSYERLLAAFAEMGGRIEDRSGEKFVDGMNVEILDQPRGVDPSTGDLIWADTIRPGVYIGDQCAVVPQVILSRREEAPADETPATHD